eukprot:1192690-Amphidinium_carterae.1
MSMDVILLHKSHQQAAMDLPMLTSPALDSCPRQPAKFLQPYLLRSSFFGQQRRRSYASHGCATTFKSLGCSAQCSKKPYKVSVNERMDVLSGSTVSPCTGCMSGQLDKSTCNVDYNISLLNVICSLLVLSNAGGASRVYVS